MLQVVAKFADAVTHVGASLRLAVGEMHEPDHAPGIAIRLRAKFYCAPCEHGGDAVKVIASIEDAAVIKQILDHLDWRTEPAPCLQTVRPRAAANDITGPEKPIFPRTTRLTAATDNIGRRNSAVNTT